LIAHSPHRGERALQAACSSIKARIELWNGTLSKLRYSRGAEQCDVPNGRWAGVKMAGAMERF